MNKRRSKELMAFAERITKKANMPFYTKTLYRALKRSYSAQKRSRSDIAAVIERVLNVKMGSKEKTV